MHILCDYRLVLGSLRSREKEILAADDSIIIIRVVLMASRCDAQNNKVTNKINKTARKGAAAQRECRSEYFYRTRKKIPQNNILLLVISNGLCSLCAMLQKDERALTKTRGIKMQKKNEINTQASLAQRVHQKR